MTTCPDWISFENVKNELRAEFQMNRKKKITKLFPGFSRLNTLAAGVVECTPSNQAAMGLKRARCWAFSLSFFFFLNVSLV